MIPRRGKRVHAILLKIKELLASRKRFWYAERDIVFLYRTHYIEYDEMLQRDVCYADFGVEEKSADCRIRITDQMFELSFESQSGSSRSSLFLDFLTRHGHCEISDAAGGRAALIIGGYRLESELTLRGNELQSAVAFDREICLALRAEPAEAQQWLQHTLRQWLAGEERVRIAVDCREEEQGYSLRIQAFVAVSSVEIDMSTESDADIVRWKESALDNQCVSYDELDKPEALKILAENGIDLPPDSDCTGWYRDEFGANTNAYILRCEHRIPDRSHEYALDLKEHPTGFPQWYRYPGFITIENDFFQCSIDSKKRRVISLHRKWQQVDADALRITPKAPADHNTPHPTI
jgi:hypothetical protein